MLIRQPFIEYSIRFPYFIEKWDDLLKWLMGKGVSLPFLNIAQDAYNRHYSIVLDYKGRRLLERLISPPKPQIWNNKQIWHTYFDYSLGREVSSFAELRAEERQGKTKITFNEMERLSKKYKKESKDRMRKKIREEVKQSLRELKQGRSFVKEIREQAPGDMKLRDERMKASRGMN